jgi:hypothetical protein
MLTARRAGILSTRYDITLDGRPLTRWDSATWRSGGSFTLDGRTFQVRSNFWGTEFTMTDDAGVTVAIAGKLSRRQWSIEIGGLRHDFRRPSWWRNHFDLVANGTAVGFVRRRSVWSHDVEAHLPTLSVAAQVFAVGVALTTWQNAETAAASTAGG